MMENIFVTLLIPCLNEKTTINKTIEDALINGNKYFKNNFEVIVADNGSTDGSIECIKEFKNVRLVNVSVQGYGSSLHNGILNARGDYVIFADADLSYPFSNIKSFKKILSKKPDLVLGSRIAGKIAPKSMPLLHRYFGTPFLTLLIRTIYRIKTTDCNSGMRMVKNSFYKKLNMKNSGMEWASEILCKTALKGGVYMEVPIKFLKDGRGKNAHLSTWSDGWRHLKAILLLKPSSVIGMAILSFLISILFYKYNFAVTFLFLVITQILILSYSTLKFLEAIIDKRVNFISNQLMQFKIVPLLLIATIIQFILLFIINDQHMGTKLMLVTVLGVTYMWAFLVETIKTHLVNKLS